MCVAIYKPANVVLSKRTLKRCFRANSDGAGFAFLDQDGRACIKKGYFQFPAFWEAYKEYATREAIIHFRYATHGGKTGDNCHPFPLPGDGALAHNGIIKWAAPSAGDSRSDTRVFVEDLLTGLIESGYDPRDHADRLELESLIEASNKMVLFYKGERVILNEAAGVWENGAWFSNTSWRYAGVWDWLSWCEDRYCLSEYSYSSTRNWQHTAVINTPARGTSADSLMLWERENEKEEEVEDRYERCAICDQLVEATIQLGADEVCWECYRDVGAWRDEI